ncbi:hypothetical protein D7Y57_16805 [Stenotrophomonas maltophilia]|nr:hypothetical protein [Stenotrophomonas maltophilia]MBZ7653087.1 hypothetical protein [Klebsiella grimontii]
MSEDGAVEGAERNRLRRDDRSHTVELLAVPGHADQCRVHAAATAEQADLHSLQVGSRANVAERADHITILADAIADHTTATSAALTEVTQVVGQDVVARLVQMLVVRHKVDFDVVAARFPRVAIRL